MPTMRIIFFYFFLLLPLPLLSQFRASLTFSQALARDWKQGETQSFELNHSLNFSKVFRLDTLRLNVAVRWAIGVQYFKAENIGQPYILPTDNELFAEGSYDIRQRTGLQYKENVRIGLVYGM